MLIACLGLFSAVAAGALVDAVRDSRQLSGARAHHAALSSQQRAEYVASAFDVPLAFRRFREVLRPGERYAIVVPATATPDRAALYHQYGLYYLYPALAAASLSQAEAVLVLDPAQDDLRSRFRPLETLGGDVWIGRRR